MSEAGIQREVAPEAPGGRSFLQRLFGAVRLDGAAYDEIAQSPSALGQAAVVALAAAAAKVLVQIAHGTASSTLVSGASIFSFWPIGAALLWIGCGQRVPYTRLLRIVGFAMAPLLLAALDLIPITPVRVGAGLLATALFLAALVIGTRQALRTTTGSAALLCAPLAVMTIFLPMLIGYVASLIGK
jgi:hypothetical protein